MKVGDFPCIDKNRVVQGSTNWSMSHCLYQSFSTELFRQACNSLSAVFGATKIYI